jgi:hypothetical protein
MPAMSALTQSLAPDPKRPWHEAVIDMWLVDPTLKQGEIAAALGKTQAWLSILVNSDAFRAKYAARKAELVDPYISEGAETRLRAVVSEAANELLERITLAPKAVSTKDLTAVVGAASRALGMGAGAAGPSFQQTLYVIPAPTAPRTVEEWQQRVVDANVIPAKESAA